MQNSLIFNFPFHYHRLKPLNLIWSFWHNSHDDLFEVFSRALYLFRPYP